MPPLQTLPKKKRKRGKTAKGSKEGEIPHLTQQLPTKEARTTKAHQKKCATSGTGKGIEEEQRPKLTIWNPAFVLSLGDLVTFEASLRDPQKGRLGLVFECLEKTFLLSKDMQELQGLRKRKLFLSLKRDLAKVKFHPLTLPSFSAIYLINHSHYFFFFNFFLQAVQESFVIEKWVYHTLSKSRKQKASLPTLRKPLLTLRKSSKRPFFT